tara:strand:- start:1903 stop:2295 length:393 start_codon:yes stop_codon:yes gene_type:complete
MRKVKTLQNIVRGEMVKTNNTLKKLLEMHSTFINTKKALNKVNYTLYNFEINNNGLKMYPLPKNQTNKLKNGDQIKVGFDKSCKQCPTPIEEGKIIHAYEANNGVYLVLKTKKGKIIRRKNKPYRFWVLK